MINENLKLTRREFIEAGASLLLLNSLSGCIGKGGKEVLKEVSVLDREIFLSLSPYYGNGKWLLDEVGWEYKGDWEYDINVENGYTLNIDQYAPFSEFPAILLGIPNSFEIGDRKSWKNNPDKVKLFTTDCRPLLISGYTFEKKYLQDGYGIPVNLKELENFKDIFDYIEKSFEENIGEIPARKVMENENKSWYLFSYDPNEIVIEGKNMYRYLSMLIKPTSSFNGIIDVRYASISSDKKEKLGELIEGIIAAKDFGVTSPSTILESFIGITQKPWKKEIKVNVKVPVIQEELEKEGYETPEEAVEAYYELLNHGEYEKLFDFEVDKKFLEVYAKKEEVTSEDVKEVLLDHLTNLYEENGERSPKLVKIIDKNKDIGLDMETLERINIDLKESLSIEDWYRVEVKVSGFIWKSDDFREEYKQKIYVVEIDDGWYPSYMMGIAMSGLIGQQKLEERAEKSMDRMEEMVEEAKR